MFRNHFTLTVRPIIIFLCNDIDIMFRQPLFQWPILFRSRSRKTIFKIIQPVSKRQERLVYCTTEIYTIPERLLALTRPKCPRIWPSDSHVYAPGRMLDTSGWLWWPLNNVWVHHDYKRSVYSLFHAKQHKPCCNGRLSCQHLIPQRP